MRQFSKSLLLWMALGVSSGIASAQPGDSIPPRDTLSIRGYELFGATTVMTPFMSDSIDPTGKKFSQDDLLRQTPNLYNVGSDIKRLSVGQDGFVVLQPIRRKDSKGVDMITLRTRLNSVGYEKGTLLIESTHPFRAFLDGNMITQGDALMAKDSIASPSVASLTLSPSSHDITIRLIDDGKAKEGITPAVRVRYVPERAVSEVTESADGKGYLSLDYMLRGENLTRVSVSPSGRYTLLTRRVMVNGKPETSYVLYKGKKEITTLGSIASEGWMPSSDKLYFTRKRDNGRQFVTYDPETMREEIVCTSIPEGYFSVSPSGNYLIYMDYKAGPSRGRDVTLLTSRDDRQPTYRDRYFLSLFDLRNGVHQPITYGFRSTSYQDMTLDDRKLIFSSHYETTSRPFRSTDFLELDLTTMTVDTLFAATGELGSVMYTSKPGQYLVTGTADAFDGKGRTLPEGMIANSYDTQLFLYNKDTKEATPLTRNFNPTVERVEALRKTFTAYFTAEDRDMVVLYRINLSTGDIVKVLTREEIVRSFGVSADGKVLAYVGQSISNSDRFYLISDAKGKEELVYDLSAEKLKDIKLGQAQTWDFTMPNGDVVPGSYYLPPNFDPSKKYPMIVYYYGGTSPVQRNFEGTYSLHMYAAQGYVVYTLNPSGSTGYGQEYAARHVNAWGKRTADEIVASVKGFCAAHPFVDASKIGCMGASYGGFMTQYLQTITDIFAAAVSHAGISALSSYWGEGYWGVGYSGVASADSFPWNNPDLYVKQSPLFNANKINTPLLLLHGTVDTNVPDGESAQMYNALKILGKEVEYIRVYDQDHFILDVPKRIEWTNSIFAWFAKWLKDDPTWWNDMYPKVNL